MTSSQKLMRRVPLDSKALAQSFSALETHNDGTFRSQPSPYDIPVEIFSEYEPESKLLSLRLNYIADEPSFSERLKSEVVIWLGKNSGRIYRIDIENIDVHDSKAVSRRIDEAIDFVSKQKGLIVTPRFEIAKKAIDVAHIDHLLTSLMDPV